MQGEQGVIGGLWPWCAKPSDRQEHALPDGFKKSDQEIDINDPMSIMNRAGGAAGGFDPFKGTGRGGK